MKLVGSGLQNAPHYFYRADGSIATGGTAQLVLSKAFSRSSFFFQNTSAGVLMVEIGVGAATAVLTSGVVTSVTVTNTGFNFTKPPLVRFLGGGQPKTDSVAPWSQNVINPSYVGLSQPNGPSPTAVPTALAVLSGGFPATISSITVTYGGSGFVLPPYVQILNSDLDPNGAALPSATVGIQLQPGGSINYNGTTCPTEPIAVWGATLGQTYVCRWMD